jgi:Protein of unknown function (DUF2914)
MMRASIFLLLVALSLPHTRASAQATQDQIVVAESGVGSGVADRQLVGRDSTFTRDVGQVYYLTRLTGAEPGATIEHVWSRDGEEVARVSLTLGGPNWRTWSSKNIAPEWTGNWRVEVVVAGNVIHSDTFTIN